MPYCSRWSLDGSPAWCLAGFPCFFLLSSSASTCADLAIRGFAISFVTVAMNVYQMPFDILAFVLVTHTTVLQSDSTQWSAT
jgi:hypothetical protein